MAPKLPVVTRAVEQFPAENPADPPRQPPVVAYTATAPKHLRGLALQAELVEAGLPDRVDAAGCPEGVRVSIFDDEDNDRTAVIAAVLNAHKGAAHAKERELPDIITKGR